MGPAMAPARHAAAAGLALCVLLAGLAPSAAGADPTLKERFAAPVPTANVTVNVSVVLAGLNLSASEKAAVIDNVNSTWWPSVSSVSLPLGVNDSVRVRFVDASGAFVEALGAALRGSFGNDTLSRVVGNYVGLFENVSPYFASWGPSTPVAHADASETAAWLAASSSSFPEVAPVAGEARLFFLNPYTVEGPYYYKVASREVDRGVNFTYETANAWGDGDGLFFQDLRAAPSHLGEGSGQGRPANFAGAPPLWSYGSSASERARLARDLAGYVDASVRILLAPSFGVTPFVPSSFTLNVTLFDGTAAQSAFDAGGVGAAHGIRRPLDILDTARAAAALGALLPLSPVEVRLTVANRSTDPEVAASLDARAVAAGGLRVVDPFGVNQDLKGRFAVPTLPIEPGEEVTVPALLAVFDGSSWVDAENVRGVTLQRSDGRAASVIISAGLDQLETLGFTETLIHEGGHALGLGHPHEVGWLAPNGTAFLETTWLRTSSSTPMTYLPNYVDSSFDSFDRQALHFGAAAATLGEAFQLRQAAFDRFDRLGYSLATVPAAALSHNGAFEAAANETLAVLARGPAFGAGPSGALEAAALSAKRAFEEAREISVLSLVSAPCCGPRRPGFLPGAEAPAVALGLAAAALLARAQPAAQRRRGTSSKAEYRALSRIGEGRNCRTADSTCSDSAERAASSLPRASSQAPSSADSTRLR